MSPEGKIISKLFCTIKSKKFWFFACILFLLGFFVSFFLPKGGGGENGFKPNLILENLPVSSVYVYDTASLKYFSDKGGSWQNRDFTRYIYDFSPDEKDLKCYYFLYDNIEKKAISGGERKCNSKLNIAVGREGGCLAQGLDSCSLYVYAKDEDGKEGKKTAISYSIDYTPPQIGIVFEDGKKYKAEISDNINVGYCWLFDGRKNIGSMKISPFPCSLKDNCFAESKEISLKEGVSSLSVGCVDQYTSGSGYLNFAFGEPKEIIVYKNHSPKIISCKVNPVSGSIDSEFSFFIEAVDSDNDDLFYEWNFDDGEKSNLLNVTHYYKAPGIYKPTVVVSDPSKEDAVCSTAWITVK